MNATAMDGQVVVNTLTSSGGDDLDELLADAGVEVERHALIDKQSCWLEHAVEGAVEGIAEGNYDWLVFTSGTAVRELAEALDELELSVEWDRVRVASVGPSTTEQIEELLGTGVDLEGTGGGSELAEALNEHIGEGTDILFPCAKETSGSLKEVIARKEAELHPLVLYRTVPVAPSEELLARADWMVVASPSGAKALAGTNIPDGLRFAAIGPTTGSALGKLSDNVSVAEKPTPEALFEVIASARV